MKRDIRIERFYPSPPESVFHALSDSATLAQWLMPNDFQPRLGHKFQFRSKPQGNWNGVTDCEVIACDPPRKLAYTWSGQSKDGKGKALGDTVVTWSLTPENGGTRLVLEHTGFTGWGEVALSVMMGMGWKKKLKTTIPALLALARAA